MMFASLNPWKFLSETLVLSGDSYNLSLTSIFTNTWNTVSEFLENSLFWFHSSGSSSSKRSRVTNKQALMADSGSSSTSPAAEKSKKSSSSFFNSPRLLFTNFSPKGFNETETMMSPTSILDNKPFSGLKNPFWSESSSPRTPRVVEVEHKRCWENSEPKRVGLGLVDALVDEKHGGEVNSKPDSRMVLFGSQLKIQIPLLLPPSEESTISSAEFAIKTRNSQLDSSSGSFSLSPSGGANSHRVFTGCLSASEMELSEDYTRVISRGPNPRTTHIFDNCIIESSCFDAGSCSAASSAKENGFFLAHHNTTSYYPSESFLSNCFHCKKNLGQGKDIYMYRGERAFCSHECRYQGMLLEEGMSKLEAEDFYMT